MAFPTFLEKGKQMRVLIAASPNMWNSIGFVDKAKAQLNCGEYSA